MAALATAPNLRNALVDFRLTTPNDRRDLQCIEYASRVATMRLGSDPSAPDTIFGFIHVVSPDDSVQANIEKAIQSEFRRLLISGLYVPMPYERQGVGQRLMRYVEELGKLQGVLAMDVVVFADVPWCPEFCESMVYSVMHWKELEDNPHGKYLLRIQEEMEKDHVSEFEWVVMRKLL